MSWSLFIDDERFPGNGFPDDNVYIARNMFAVRELIRTLGSMPSFISFDHDLGENQPTGYDIAKYLVDVDIQGIYKFPDGFDYHVHSQNPVGKRNIEQYLNRYFEIREEISETHEGN